MLLKSILPSGNTQGIGNTATRIRRQHTYSPIIADVPNTTEKHRGRENGDQDIYRDLLAEQAQKARVEIWAYCLMPNHVHLIAVPSTQLFSAIREAESSGRPLATADFVADLERRLGRHIARRAPGRKPRPTAQATPL